MNTGWKRAGIEALLRVGDPRTLKHLVDRAGLTEILSEASISFDQFFNGQRFVDQNNEGLKALRSLLTQAQSV